MIVTDPLKVVVVIPREALQCNAIGFGDGILTVVALLSSTCFAVVLLMSPKHVLFKIFLQIRCPGSSLKRRNKNRRRIFGYWNSVKKKTQR